LVQQRRFGAGLSILNKKSKRTPSLPSKADILAFIRNQPGKVGTREIARAFGLKNALRADLKRMLRELADEGSVEKRRKKLHHPGTLPSTVLADVTARDSGGDLIATPDEWDEDAHGPAPKIRVYAPRKPHPGEAAGLGDRVLLRVEEADEDNGIRHRGRIIKIIDHPKHRVLGIFRKIAHGGGRLEPVDKKMLGKELAIPAGASADAQEGDLVAVATSRAPRLGLPTGRVVERLGSLKSERAVSIIAIHAHGIPSVFRRETQQEADAAKPAALSGREDWRHVPLVTIDPPPRTTTMRCRRSQTRRRIIVAASSSTWPLPMSPTMCGRARRSTAKRLRAAIQFTFPTASCRCCRSGYRMISAHCARMKTARHWQSGW